MKPKKITKKKLDVSTQKLSSLSKEELNSLVGGNLDKLSRLNTIDLMGQLNRGYM